jgi:hypothetical protein
MELRHEDRAHSIRSLLRLVSRKIKIPLKWHRFEAQGNSSDIVLHFESSKQQVGEKTGKGQTCLFSQECS